MIWLFYSLIKEKKINLKKKLEEKISEEHPRNKKGEAYGFCESVFDVDTGYHLCSKTSKNTDMGTMGIGISLYFKFLKYVICFFLLFTFLSIPSIYFSSLSFFCFFIKILIV